MQAQMLSCCRGRLVERPVRKHNAKNRRKKTGRKCCSGLQGATALLAAELPPTYSLCSLPIPSLPSPAPLTPCGPTLLEPGLCVSVPEPPPSHTPTKLLTTTSQDLLETRKAWLAARHNHDQDSTIPVSTSGHVTPTSSQDE